MFQFPLMWEVDEDRGGMKCQLWWSTRFSRSWVPAVARRLLGCNPLVLTINHSSWLVNSIRKISRCSLLSPQESCVWNPRWEWASQNECGFRKETSFSNPIYLQVVSEVARNLKAWIFFLGGFFLSGLKRMGNYSNLSWQLNGNQFNWKIFTVGSPRVNCRQ